MTEEQRKASILIAEDEESVRKPLADSLRNKEHIVYEAKDGQEAYDLAEKNKPEVILLDVAMPVLGGIECLKKIRQNEWGKSMKVILITNANDFDVYASALELGVNLQIIKSNYSLEEITDLVEKATSNVIS